jgi:hypothetical protein
MKPSLRFVLGVLQEVEFLLGDSSFNPIPILIETG